jgi:hypothetical protein
VAKKKHRDEKETQGRAAKIANTRNYFARFSEIAESEVARWMEVATPSS